MMSDRVASPEHQVECLQQRQFFNSAGNFNGVPMLRRIMSGVVCGDQLVLARQKVKILYQQGLKEQEQPQQCSLSSQQQPNVSELSLA